MKCAELKKIVDEIDDDTEVCVSIFGFNKSGDVFLSLINDTIYDRLILSFADDKDVLR